MEYVLDTHPLVFLMYEPAQLTTRVRNILRSDDNAMLVPTMAILELQYLIEIGRIEGAAVDVIGYIEQTRSMRIVSFADTELRETIGDNQTRDPFDRIILATATSRDIPIITRDRWMKSVYRKTVW